MKKILLTFLLFFLPVSIGGSIVVNTAIVQQAEAVITIGNTSSDPNGESSTTQTWSHTSNGDMLIIFTTYREGGPGHPTSVTFNGDPATLRKSQADDQNFFFTRIYELANPDAGAHNVVLTFPNSHAGKGGSAISISGAQFKDSSGDGNNSDGTVISSTVSGFASGDLTLDSAVYGSTADTTSSKGGNQTTICDDAGSGSSGAGCHSSYNTTDGAMTWTKTAPAGWMALSVVLYEEAVGVTDNALDFGTDF